ncbi:MAG: hypothetical protein J5841_01350, partial [Clostridia bacterium]|nr:hypothetical protein [Clostridia bacterium]
TEDGTEEYRCSVCGDVWMTGTIAKLGHSYGEWIIIREPTYTEEGEQEHHCIRCDHTERESIPVLSIPEEPTPEGEL